MERIINTIKGTAWALVVCGLITLLCGCKTKYIEVPTIKTEYKARTDTLRLSRVDSIYQRDSVYLTKWLQGDTLYIYKERTAYKYKFLADTVYKATTDTLCKTDSVSVPYPVERELTKWERRYMSVGRYTTWAAVGVVVVMIIAVVVGWLRRRKG